MPSPRPCATLTSSWSRARAVTRRAVEAGQRLKAILRAGVGVDIIDVQAFERGVGVAHCPG
ncbi:MAG: hypothetical protein U1F43_24625 [Myxococcota bacterium]